MVHPAFRRGGIRRVRRGGRREPREGAGHHEAVRTAGESGHGRGGADTARSTGRSRFGPVIDHISIPTEAGSFDAIAAGPEDGRPVLLLHGFPEAATEWEHQVATLGVLGYRAVAPDQRGYSPNVRPEPASDYSIDHLVEDVVTITERLGWPK